jgi:UDP-GlcNAc:undecaprenyl-phosphate/decaprenyl-phosphate GlcNAc-1-phosphate transferase
MQVEAMIFPPLAIPFGVAFLGSVILTVPVRYLALRFGMIDRPGPRKVHLKPIPLLGGIAICLGFLLALLIVFHGIHGRQLLAIVAGGALVAVVGFLDDRGLLHHQVKLFVGMPVAALFLLAAGIRAHVFSQFVPGAAGFVLDCCLTILWVVGITASFSILDHMDGLCAGIAAIAAVFFAITASRNGETSVSMLATAAAGAAFGFLIWNFNPAKIFMGDGGAMFLGFLMATLGLTIHPEGSRLSVTVIPLLILGVPIFDTTLVSISRSRRGLLPFTSPGKDHTAHRLSNLGLGHRGAVVVLYALTVLFGIVALVIPRVSSNSAYLLVGTAVVCGLIAVWFLEGAPYERQDKPQVSSLTS